MAEVRPPSQRSPRPGARRPVALRALALSALFVAGALLSALPAACVPALTTDEAPCPCGAGFHCCPVENRCIADGQVCPVNNNCALPPVADTRFEIGAGAPDDAVPVFTPLDTDGDYTLQVGPQGGYHLYVQVRMLGLDPRTFTLTRAVYDPTDPSRDISHALCFQTDSPSMTCDDSASWILLQEPITYMCPSRVKGQAMAGRDLVLRFEGSDAAGRTLAAERTIHPNCPEGDLACQTDTTVGCAAP